MSKSRRVIGKEFKAKVFLEALKEKRDLMFELEAIIKSIAFLKTKRS